MASPATAALLLASFAMVGQVMVVPPASSAMVEEASREKAAGVLVASGILAFPVPAVALAELVQLVVGHSRYLH